MRRFRGLGRRTLLVLCAVAVGVAFMMPAGFASAADNLIPTKISLLKWGGNPRVGKLYKIVSKPTVVFALPAVGTGPEINGGDLTVQVGAGQVTCDLSNTALWKGLGNPAGSKGYKYVNKAAPTGDLCKIVIVKEKVIKVLAKGVGSVALPGDPGTNPDVTMVLTVGLDRYCAEATAPHFKEKADTLIKMKDQPAPGACAGPPTTTTTIITTTTTAPPTTTTTGSGCDCSGFTQAAFETGIGSGTAGVLRNFRCSNASSSACIDSVECDFGTCLLGPNFCWDGSTAGPPCTLDAQCQGTCGEVIAGNLPLDLAKGGLYTGGGLNSVPLPFPVPDQGLSIHNVSGTTTLTLTATTPGDVGQRNCTQGRTCTGGTNDGLHCVLPSDCPGGTCTDNCIFGPPLPIPNAGTPATSVCTVNVIDINSGGTVECNGGDTDITTPLRSVIYLNGDLFKSSTPPDIPGVQPCPLCDTLCVGGTKADFPCDDDSDCPGSTCNTSTECLGGPNDGNPCTPATSDSAALGDSQNAYPTSHDCPNDPLASITDNIGGLPIEFGLTSGTQEVNAVDHPKGTRTFCGFCRDVNVEGSLCFEGSTNPGCPGGAGSGNAVPCSSDGDCSAPFESCAQRNAGAFSEAASTRITVTGDPGGACLDDGLVHGQTLVSIFCIPPTFDATVDAAGDLPGPGAALLVGDAQLLP